MWQFLKKYLFVKNNSKLIVEMISLSVLILGFSFINPIASKKIIDVLSSKREVYALNVISASTLGALICSGFIYVCNNYVANSLVENISVMLRMDILRV